MGSHRIPWISQDSLAREAKGQEGRGTCLGPGELLSNCTCRKWVKFCTEVAAEVAPGVGSELV
jgi:hypothetical protein